uniref:Uncharacterized protein n=1 Tax=Anguilla anguilla TaxID=7936 RepID=A0A0E9V3Y5_ANGAN
MVDFRCSKREKKKTSKCNKKLPFQKKKQAACFSLPQSTGVGDNFSHFLLVHFPHHFSLPALCSSPS